MQDTLQGTQGNLPHYSQVVFQFLDVFKTTLTVDGVNYTRGYGNPGDSNNGEANNCLIDSIRQTLGNLQCDRRLVRADLQLAFSDFDTNDRRYVSCDSFLDIEEHWRAIISSLFRHNTSGRPTHCNVDDYCVLALSEDGDNGTVSGDRNASHTLVIVNVRDRHFDPCFPLS